MFSCSLTSKASYIFFFTLSKGLDDAQSFIGYVLLTKLPFFHSRDYDEQKALLLPVKGSFGVCQGYHKCETLNNTRIYLRGLETYVQMRLQSRAALINFQTPFLAVYNQGQHKLTGLTNKGGNNRKMR